MTDLGMDVIGDQYSDGLERRPSPALLLTAASCSLPLWSDSGRGGALPDAGCVSVCALDLGSVCE